MTTQALDCRLNRLDRYGQASRLSSILSLWFFAGLGSWLIFGLPVWSERPVETFTSPAPLALEVYEPPEPVAVIEPPTPMPEPEIDLTPPPLPQPIEFEPEIIEVQAEKDEQKPEIKPEPITKAAPPKVSPPAPTTNVQAPPVQPGLPVEAAAPDPALIDRFIADFLRVVEKNKFYPPKAKRVGLTGTVKVRVTFDRQGRVGQITLVAGDYDPELGQGALETIRRAAGRWRPRQGGPEVLVVPIGFKLR